MVPLCCGQGSPLSFRVIAEWSSHVCKNLFQKHSRKHFKTTGIEFSIYSVQKILKNRTVKPKPINFSVQQFFPQHSAEK